MATALSIAARNAAANAIADGTASASGTVGVSNADLTITDTSDVVEVSSATYTVPAS